MKILNEDQCFSTKERKTLTSLRTKSSRKRTGAVSSLLDQCSSERGHYRSVCHSEKHRPAPWHCSLFFTELYSHRTCITLWYAATAPQSARLAHGAHAHTHYIHLELPSSSEWQCYPKWRKRPLGHHRPGGDWLLSLIEPVYLLSTTKVRKLSGWPQTDNCYYQMLCTW